MSVHELAETMRRIEQLVERQTAAADRLTATVDQLRGGILNDVLYAGTVALDPTRFTWHQTFEVPFASVAVYNTAGASGLWVASGSPDPGSTAPGRGRFQVSGNALVVPLVGTEVSLWATTATNVGIAVFGRLMQPGGALV